MENKTLLTVNVVTYNHRPWISKCLDSILEQQTDFKFIVRIFDDCSTDGTTEVCAEYAERYPDIIKFYPAEKNLGLPANPLRAYSNITTPYYLYIEGDDWREDVHGFQEQVDCLERNSSVAFCMSQVINYHDGVYYDIHPFLEDGLYSMQDVINNPDRLFFSNLLSRVVRTKCIKIDKNYPQAYLYDVTQMYELLEHGDFYFIKKCFGVYNNTTSGMVTSLRLFDRIDITYKHIYDYNVYTDGKYALNLISYFYKTIGWVYRSEKKKILNIDGGEKCINDYKNSTDIKYIIRRVRRFIYMFIPPIIPEGFHKIRNIIRFIRRERMK